MKTTTKGPKALVIDEDTFVCQCLSDKDGPYVDLRIDTVPVSNDDRDFSQNVEVLRRLAAWVTEAADWLESRAGEGK